jgi:hypothetical protein
MAAPVVILATDLRPEDPAWSRAEAQAANLQPFAARSLGVEPRVALARLPAWQEEDLGDYRLGSVIDRVIDHDIDRAGGDARVVFLLPAAFELNIWQRTMLGEELTEARRRHASVSIHHDTVDPSHPFLLECFSSHILQALEARGVLPDQAGLLLVADGRGDALARADSYRLMRLLWEQAGLGLAEVGFVRHTQPGLPTMLQRCLREPRTWVLLPQCQWGGELHDYASVMLADHQRAHPEASEWCLLDPPRDHPAILAWFEQRLRRLWQDKRARQAIRVPSARSKPSSSPATVWSGDEWVAVADAVVEPRAGLVGRVGEPARLAEFLARVLPRADRYLVKVTWHGYAQGTYTGPAALDLLLGALPGKAVVLEGHTSSRNLGGLEIDWADAATHRTWVRQQDSEFLRRTGLADVIAKHRAQYVNVTEAWWDGACASNAAVRSVLGDVRLQNPELAEFVPTVLCELRGAPMISFARFKGPTRLGISNLFGLIPHPLRTEWHGASITDFAAACCDLALLYGCLFPQFGLVEAFDSAVRWDRQGLYRSRWGNYDLVQTEGVFTLSEGLVGADILASQLQGQDVSRSGFFDVVRERLSWPAAAADMRLPGDLQALLA